MNRSILIAVVTLVAAASAVLLIPQVDAADNPNNLYVDDNGPAILFQDSDAWVYFQVGPRQMADVGWTFEVMTPDICTAEKGSHDLGTYLRITATEVGTGTIRITPTTSYNTTGWYHDYTFRVVDLDEVRDRLVCVNYYDSVYQEESHDVPALSIPRTLRILCDSPDDTVTVTLPDSVIVRTDDPSAQQVGWRDYYNGASEVLPFGSTVDIPAGTTRMFGAVWEIPEKTDKVETIVVSCPQEARVGDTITVTAVLGPLNLSDFSVEYTIGSGAEHVIVEASDVSRGMALKVTALEPGRVSILFNSVLDPSVNEVVSFEVVGSYTWKGYVGDVIESAFALAGTIDNYSAVPGITFYPGDDGNTYMRGEFTQAGTFIIENSNDHRLTFIITEWDPDYTLGTFFDDIAGRLAALDWQVIAIVVLSLIALYFIARR